MTEAPAAPLLRQFRSQRLRVTSLLFVAYVGYYFCRVTVPVALPVVAERFEFSNTQAGLILSAYYAAYAFSKLANGFLGDRLGGKVMLLIGITGSVVCNAAFGFGGELTFFILIWATNAYFQSMGWLSIVPIMARWYRPQETGRAMGMMSLSYQMGDFVARSSAAFFIVALGWAGLFWAHAAILALLGLALLTLLKPSPTGHGLPDVDVYSAGGEAPPEGAEAAAQSAATQAVRRAEAKLWLRGMLMEKLFWVVCLSYLFLSILRYIFWGWSVQYLIDNGATLGTAALTSAIFPLLGSAGSITAGWISDSMGARRGPVLAIMGVMLTASIYVFSRVPGSEPAWLMVALGFVGFTLYGPYSLMAGAVAMDFGWKHSSATAAGIIDAVGAVGAILTGVGMGYLIDVYGWTNAFNIIISLAAVSMVLNFALWNLSPRHETSR